jgi:hypothetical protein
MSGNDPSGGWFVVRHPQYVEEAQFGVFPGNPDLQWIGAAEAWDPQVDIPPIIVRPLGSEDPAYLLKGQENYSFTLSHFMQGSTWTKYAVNPQGGGSGSIDKSISIAAAIKQGGAAGVTYYYQMLGCRARSITISGKPGDAIKCSMELLCREIPKPSTNDPTGTGSWASDNGVVPFIFTSGGLNPISIHNHNGAPNPVPVTDISVTINRNPEAIITMGDGKAAYIPAKQREITGSITLVWLSQDHYTDLVDYNNKDLSWSLSTSPYSALTITGCKFHRLDSFSIKPTEVIYEKYSFTGLSASLI